MSDVSQRQPSPKAKRAFEVRWLEAGNLQFSLRLRRGAANKLDQLSILYGTTRRDVIEGLLLGTIKPHHFERHNSRDVELAIASAMREHSLCREEAMSYLLHARDSVSLVDTTSDQCHHPLTQSGVTCD